MNDSQRLIVSAQFHRQAADLIHETLPLHQELLKAHQEWYSTINEQNLIAEVDRLRELHDRTFGYRIELECLLVRISRVREARFLHLTTSN